MLGQGWIKKAERIRCSAPLPENSADPVLTRMLAHAPHQVPSREDKEGSGEVKHGLHTNGTLRTVSREIGTPVLESNWGGESNIPSPHGKKRAAPEDLKAEASKQGKKSLSGGPVSGSNVAEQRPQGGPFLPMGGGNI